MSDTHPPATIHSPTPGMLRGAPAMIKFGCTEFPQMYLAKANPQHGHTPSLHRGESVYTLASGNTHTTEPGITVRCEAVKTHTCAGTGSGIDCTFIHAHRIARASLSVGQHGCVQFSLAVNDGEGLHGQFITCTGAHTTSNLCYRYYLG